MNSENNKATNTPDRTNIVHFGVLIALFWCIKMSDQVVNKVKPVLSLNQF